MIHILDETEDAILRFCHATQSGVQFKTYELFISGIFHLIVVAHGSPQVTETGCKGGLLYNS